jgi:hypothetical protein
MRHRRKCRRGCRWSRGLSSVRLVSQDSPQDALGSWQGFGVEQGQQSFQVAPGVDFARGFGAIHRASIRPGRASQVRWGVICRRLCARPAVMSSGGSDGVGEKWHRGSDM